MAKKGIDTVFVHYGIRREDMAVIEQLCEKHQLDQEWVKEDLLKAFHEKKIRNQELDNKSIEKIIDRALQKIN